MAPTLSLTTEVVPFHDDHLPTVKQDNTVYVSLRPITEALGIDWKSQTCRLRRGQGSGDITTPCAKGVGDSSLSERQLSAISSLVNRFGITNMPIQTQGGLQNSLCIPLNKLNGWLFTINPNKIRPDLKAKLIQYQDECFEILYQYWHKSAGPQAPGAAIPSRVPAPADTRALALPPPAAPATSERTRNALAFHARIAVDRHLRRIQNHLLQGVYQTLSDRFHIPKHTQLPDTQLSEAITYLQHEIDMNAIMREVL